MCGIAGLIGQGSLADLQAAVQRMLTAQVHRGPDDEGVMSLSSPDGSVLFGSRRLAIIDLSPAAHQPMANEDQTIWVVHNGEIYNFLELRETLIARGHRFRSRTDTEVIVHAYEEYADECVQQFRGMFAFAVWDTKRQRLLLARDRLGEKPLYFAWDGKRFLFASEVRALLASGFVEKRLNPSAIRGYLTFGSVPAPLSLIDGVQALGPGCLLKFRDGQVQIARYWDVRFTEGRPITEPEAIEALRHHVREAVQLRLVSDRPVGAFVSGGIDSSSVVALMREAGVGKLRTYSLVFDQPEFDEGPFARLLARRFETDHTEYRVTAPEVWRRLDDVIAAMDQPSVDGVNTYFVSHLARSCGTVVALSGLGGDELFGGYSSFWLAPRLVWLGRFLQRLPGSSAAVRRFIGWLSADGRSQKLRGFLRQAPSAEAAYLAVKGLFTDEALEGLLLPEALAASRAFDPMAYLNGVTDSHEESLVNRISRLELRTYLHNQLLRDTDAMSMAHALEVRVPLLDHLLIELVARLPGRLKFGPPPKDLLVKAMRTQLPRQITDRPKGAFMFPFEQWMKHEWRTAIEQELCTGAPGGPQILFVPQGVRALWGDFLRGRLRWSRPWAVFILQRWLRSHLGSAGVALVDEQRSVHITT